MAKTESAHPWWHCQLRGRCPVRSMRKDVSFHHNTSIVSTSLSIMFDSFHIHFYESFGDLQSSPALAFPKIGWHWVDGVGQGLKLENGLSAIAAEVLVLCQAFLPRTASPSRLRSHHGLVRLHNEETAVRRMQQLIFLFHLKARLPLILSKSFHLCHLVTFSAMHDSSHVACYVATSRSANVALDGSTKSPAERRASKPYSSAPVHELRVNVQHQHPRVPSLSMLTPAGLPPSAKQL